MDPLEKYYPEIIEEDGAYTLSCHGYELLRYEEGFDTVAQYLETYLLKVNKCRDRSAAITVSTLPTLIDGQHSVLIVALHATQLVGSAKVRLLTGQADLHDVFVHPDHRGNGVGDLLMREAIATAQAQQLPLALRVDSANIPALTLYQRHGFVAYSSVDEHGFIDYYVPLCN